MADLIIGVNTPKTIDINSLINNNSNGYWKIVGNTLVHDNIRESYIDRYYSFLEVGKSYRVTYTTMWTSCNVKVFLGDSPGVTTNSTGTFTQDIAFTGTNKRLRFYSSGNVTITYLKIEQLVTDVEDTVLELDNTSYIENKSFTLSYSPIAKQWLFLHSYIPNNYIIHPNSLLTKRNDSQLMQMNKGDYGKYFDSDIKPFIIETIFNEYPLDTKVFDNLTINLKSTLNDSPTNKFFDKIIMNTEYQCSGEIELDMTNLTKKERNWMINKFSDLTNSTNTTLFSKAWADIKDQYPIDKVINNNKIDYNKPWFNRARFRDKFLKVRFIENNLQNNKLMINFVSSVYRTSQR